ncbi:MAG: hypothetical protein ACXACR_09290, partial [Candidatus Hodarchaeales archaeon]|jgi:hypothetical protein
MRDWKKVAQDYDAFIFDFNKTGTYLPLISWDTRWKNFNRDTFYLPSYVGNPPSDEAINGMAAVISATLVGINKSNQDGNNWVLMCENWFNSENGQNLYLNNRVMPTGITFWYELFPTVLFYQLAYFYPDTGDFQNEMRIIADKWYNATVALGGNVDPWTVPNYLYTAFNFDKMKPFSGNWREPDAAAAVAWLEYIAWLKWGDPKYLNAADWCLQYLDKITFNPYYEVLLPYGAYLAARMNAELNRNFDIHKIINWCFDPSDIRSGWGVIAENWGGYDAYGLHGSTTDGGGYAFLMTTFENVGALVPVARYDDRYARALGKYVLNAANAARLLYGNGLDAEHQDNEDWLTTYDPNNSIGYEGLRKESGGISPLATGDDFGLTNLGLYGSSHVGIFGGIISPTNDEKILQLDTLATDYYHNDSYPTYLYYNPYTIQKTIEIDVGSDTIDLYDATTDSFLALGVTGLTSFTLPADSAAVVVVVPANGITSQNCNKKLINGIVVDYNIPIVDSFSPTTIQDHKNDWYTSTFQIDLIASDQCGVAETYYRINQGPTQTVRSHGHPRITTDGANNTLEYWSVDKAGNEELPHHFLTEIKLDKTPPTIEILSRQPEGNVTQDQVVRISANVTDVVTGVKNVTLSYTTDNETTWVNLLMIYNSSTGLYYSTIPSQPIGTWVQFKITSYDNLLNSETISDPEPYFVYQESSLTSDMTTGFGGILELGVIVLVLLRKKNQK